MNQQILAWIQKEFSIRLSDIKPISGGYQNLVFEITHQDEEKILRISDDCVRKNAVIQSEIKWCNALVDAGISVCNAIKMPSDDYIKSFVANDRLFHAVVFKKATGVKLTYPEYLNNDEVYGQLGILTGKIHAHSKAFTPKQTIQRPSWHENSYLKQFKTVVPLEKKHLHKAYEDLMESLENLEKNTQTYGLIHGDINLGNFHIHNQQITLFDFDECQWSWFVEDIAIQLFYTVYVFGEDDREFRKQAGKKFLKHFLKAYQGICPLESSQLSLMNTFLKLREIIVYVGICKKWDFEHLNAWQTDYFSQTEERIGQRKPILDMSEIL